MYAFFAPGPTEIILIVLGILLLFGGKKIPELMKGLGSGLKEFKKASNLDEQEEKEKESGRIESSQS
ncbi:MAG: twin-arginine translocase TatA/TatE family subunit [Chlorobi bacterium]|nr:twin-arginine translocase TatA/TatE family subunit [Chlorobiota bacterium]